ncbi:PepSY-associated TM helix domain-containing protein [Pollutimonas sp. H1-120]|uniref:PepSY-associated TM helix domain-containing protein n=1 Tax=Pollutimonas sp. H1-120 TaxID=3148824 RepID=UPI003B51DCB3
MRSLWRRLHRWLGLSLALFLFVISLSGSVIAFEHELDAWLNPELFNTGSDGKALAPDRLVSGIEKDDPRLRVTLLPLDARPGRSIEVQVAQRRDRTDIQADRSLGFDRLFIDPTTGRVLGRRQWGETRLDRKHLLPMLNRLHRTMLLPGRWGSWLLGSVALGWLALSLMGIYLSLPARGGVRVDGSGVARHTSSRFGRRWWPSWRIKRGVRGARLAFDLHRATGLWTAAAAIFLGCTGVSLSLSNEVVKPLVGLFSPVTPHPLAMLPEAIKVAEQPILSAKDALRLARAALPRAASSFEPWYIGHVSRLGVYRVAFKEREFRERAGRLRYEQVYIDDQSGAPRSLYGYHSGSSADRFLIWQYPIHSGKVLSTLGRIWVCLSGLGIALLCGAGVYLWARRR